MVTRPTVSHLVPQTDPSVKLYNHGEGPYCLIAACPCESGSSRFQLGEGPSRGLLRDCTISPMDRFTTLTGTLGRVTITGHTGSFCQQAITTSHQHRASVHCPHCHALMVMMCYALPCNNMRHTIWGGSRIIKSVFNFSVLDFNIS